jgi:hypothetical protein
MDRSLAERPLVTIKVSLEDLKEEEDDDDDDGTSQNIVISQPSRANNNKNNGGEKGNDDISAVTIKEEPVEDEEETLPPLQPPVAKDSGQDTFEIRDVDMMNGPTCRNLRLLALSQLVNYPVLVSLRKVQFFIYYYSYLALPCMENS